MLSIFWPSVCLLWRNVCNLGLIPGLGRSPGEGNGYPLQYSGLENPMGERSLAGYSPWGRKEARTTERLFTSLLGLLPIFNFFFFILSSMSHLYILDENPLLVTSCTNIFSHSIGFCILLVFSFGLPKPLNLIRSHLFIFAFISFALGDWSKKIWLQFMVKNVFPAFSYRRFMVPFLHLGFLGGTSGKEPAYQCSRHKRHGFDP